MTHDLETTYHPMLEPDRPATWPQALPRRADAFVALSSRPRARTLGRLEVIAARWRPWATFAVADSTLLAFARRDPLGLQALSGTPVHGATTMDVPYYGFFTRAQKDRAVLRAVWAQHESLDAFDRLGLRCLPLVKGLEPNEIDLQVELLGQAGVAHAAFCARELLLERNPDPVVRFVRACARHRIAPVVLGTSRPFAHAAGAGVHHAVSAALGYRLTAAGRRTPVREPFRSTMLGRWVKPADVAALADHNFLMLRARFPRHRPLSAFQGWT